MAHQIDLAVRQNRNYMQFDELELKCYKPEEVRRISVLEVNQINTFDESGFPISGGLYDAKIGAEEDQPCDTCGLGYFHCPGHYGHIELVAPVFNPLLFSFISNLMKGTCIHCHRFTADSNSLVSKTSIAKIRALKFGVPEVLGDIEGEIKTRIDRGEIIGEVLDVLSEETFLEQIDTIIAHLAGLGSVEQLRDNAKVQVRHHTQLKNNMAKRNEIVKDEFLRKYLLKRKVRCPRCKRSNGVMRNDSGRAFLLDFVKQTKSISENKGKGTLSKISNMIAEKAEENLRETQKKLTEKRKAMQLDGDRPDLLGFGSIEDELAEYKKDDIKSLTLPNILLDPLALSNQLLAEQLEQIEMGKCNKLVWRAAEVREHFRLVWQRESILLKQIFPMFDQETEEGRYPIDDLFIETLIVEPSRFRPIRMLRGERYEHPTTVNLRRLLEANQMLTLLKMHMQPGGLEAAGHEYSATAKEFIEQRIQGKTDNEKLHHAYLDLQLRINALYDQSAVKAEGARAQPGLKQTLEKKEGLFRMHMMGKRVNFACRSVITPDPYLDVDEIGIPDLFARRLTFPEPVSHLNVQTMTKLVWRGPEIHPGANYIEIAGTLGRPPMKIRLFPGKNNRHERSHQAHRLKPGDTETVHSMPDIVLRHLKNGDRLLMNRQPSLHKPSIMGHRARVLPGQKALRMNYAPCKAYNADFDGDEMNGHFVQNRMAQSEVAELANVGSNFLVPKDGTPILGLIQDHVVSGVLMTIRGRFFEREDYMHLVLSAFAETSNKLEIPPPTIMRPKHLWTGKQVITAIIKNCCPANQPLINLTGKAKTSTNCWKGRDPETGNELPAPKFEMSESQIIFREGELLCGVLDKAHYGATQFGLIHCCYELYGPKVAVQLLSCFSRAFTTYLQFHGFTLGVADILIRKKADKERRRLIRQLRKCGDSVVQKVFGLPENTPQNKLRYALATAYNNPRDRDTVKLIDYTMKQTISKFAEQINNACVPSGLIRDFPFNSLQLMVQSGSKGSLVNSIQISCALGQIELEGQRPPLSIVGRSLPSFRNFDLSPRAGGFVEQRFLTGINPQELFFHTMAGREGLVDTAVKTSRSGYLQRCIIKHLEGITVRYDHTVRDYDNSIIQFRYGEDGLDVGRSTFLNAKQFPFLAENSKAMEQLIIPPSTNEQLEQEKWHLTETEQHYKKISKFKKRRMKAMRKEQEGEHDQESPIELKMATINKGYRHSAFNEFHLRTDTEYLLKDSIVSDWKRLSPEDRQKYQPKYGKNVPMPVDITFNPTTNLGALSERMLDQLRAFIHDDEGDVVELDDRQRQLFKRAIYWKGLRAFADPGECVGLLAAQSIGEPSTQMTLNTFHFAGRGEMNVTLGIPRLREILMTQSKNISTPMAEVCIRHGVSEKQVAKLKCEMNPVALRQVLRKFTLEERIEIKNENQYNCYRVYELTLELLSNAQRDPMARHLKRRRILREIEQRFGLELAALMRKRHKEMIGHQQIQQRTLQNANQKISEEEDKSGRKKANDDNLASDEEDAIGALRGEGDADEIRLNKRHLDDAAEYEGEDQDRGDAGIEEDDEDDILEIEQNGHMGDSEEEEVDEDEEEKEDGDDEKQKRETNAEYEERIQSASRDEYIAKYTYDRDSEHWCKYLFQIPEKNKGIIDVSALIEHEIDKFIVTRVAGVEKCVVREEQRNGRQTQILQTQGINKQAFYARSEFLDVNTIYSNDINWVWENYGIEAAMRTIVKEMNNVFGVYGIEVNPRHLTLTADYMTFTGAILAFNRGAMEQSSSPLQKITFETTVAFMQKAIIEGQFDSLFSPSARIVLGQLIRGGTGAFDLLTKAEYAVGGGRNSNSNEQPISKIAGEIQEMRRKRRRRKDEFYY